MSLAEDIQKMEWYKTFEPYIRTKDIAKRARGEIELVPMHQRRQKKPLHGGWPSACPAGFNETGK